MKLYRLRHDWKGERFGLAESKQIVLSDDLLESQPSYKMSVEWDGYEGFQDVVFVSPTKLLLSEKAREVFKGEKVRGLFYYPVDFVNRKKGAKVKNYLEAWIQNSVRASYEFSTVSRLWSDAESFTDIDGVEKEDKPREPGKGLYVQEHLIAEYDIFRLMQSPYCMLCTEALKKIIMNNGLTGIAFMEYGDTYNDEVTPVCRIHTEAIQEKTGSSAKEAKANTNEKPDAPKVRTTSDDLVSFDDAKDLDKFRLLKIGLKTMPEGAFPKDLIERQLKKYLRLEGERVKELHFVNFYDVNGYVYGLWRGGSEGDDFYAYWERNQGGKEGCLCYDINSNCLSPEQYIIRLYFGLE